MQSYIRRRSWHPTLLQTMARPSNAPSAMYEDITEEALNEFCGMQKNQVKGL